ncbi:MAG: bifunctional (p)ppGpp synthetase/guanosine-3',5'-bis(diphosphate) 3'-pyrophosphohydrolase [Actinobacteria bacterium]|nr:bifunctional (p)ppGpp synthetase/guanosine-3',5'-bis(diphosphate) 3'-pyrophosphohydrolase [Actinomycetota bacterium]
MVSVAQNPLQGEVLAPLLEPVLDAYLARFPGAEVLTIERACALALQAHKGQLRRTGEPYVTHPIAVAAIVAELGMDAKTIAAALLHDAVEDTAVTNEMVAEMFDDEVAAIVDGVTKLDSLDFATKQEQQAATIRKMFVAMARDLRVIMIKLADRLHNMRTLSVMPVEKQRLIAQETLDIYAPIAHRLGVQRVKSELEDLAFATLEPRRYAEIEQMVASRTPEREEYVELVMSELDAKLQMFGIEADVRGRHKHLWSIYEKMVVEGKEFDSIFDLIGLRVIVEEEKECWATLGAIHALWRPLENRFKDYINSPKFNQYQSLHTTVLGPQAKEVEIQIRTKEMHYRAENGVAAHWRYKENPTPNEIAWMQRMVEVEQGSDDSVSFLENLKLDLITDEIYVYTPKGRIIAITKGSTPIDFAYAVHTEVGHRCIGAKVNNRLVPLETELKSADVVEIVTDKSDSASPSRDWLTIAVSSRAKSKIRQWFQRERRVDAMENGREELISAVRRAGLPIATSISSDAMNRVIDQLNLDDLDAMLVAIGEHHLSAQSVTQRLERELSGGNDEQMPTSVSKVSKLRRDTRRTAGVYVEGLDDVMIHLARCCSPVPGDAIMGFVTQGRGVSVHRTDCSNAAALASRLGDRVIDVAWDGSTQGIYRATLKIHAFDRTRLLFDVSRVVAEYHLNIVASSSTTSTDRIVKMTFEVEFADPSHLSTLIVAIKNVDGVFEAFRDLPGRKGFS